jgi:hypothetical protein
MEVAMLNTPRLNLPLLAAAQAQKHVTHNEALMQLDDVVQLGVIDMDLATPPSSPAVGARYIVAASPTGAWAGQAGRIAIWRDGIWIFQVPQNGWLAFVETRQAYVYANGTSWLPFGGSLTMLGINATADTTQRLALRSGNSLFDHDGGSHRLKINRSLATDTASLLFQSNYQGRAEFGLQGDENFRVKVSANGTTWADALTIDRNTGLSSVAASPVASLGVATKAYVDSAADSGPFEYQTAANQSVTGGTTWTKITGFTGMRVASALFNTTSSTFTPNRSGVYLFIGQVQLTLGTPGTAVIVTFARNGTPGGNRIVRNMAAGAVEALQLSSMLALNAGDTVELMVYTTSNCTIELAYTSFGGARL